METKSVTSVRSRQQRGAACELKQLGQTMPLARLPRATAGWWGEGGGAGGGGLEGESEGRQPHVSEPERIFTSCARSIFSAERRRNEASRTLGGRAHTVSVGARGVDGHPHAGYVGTHSGVWATQGQLAQRGDRVRGARFLLADE